MPDETHFIQAGDDPVLIGAGSEVLACACGQALIRDYEPLRVLGIGIKCARCGTVTTTPPLPDTERPSREAVIAPPWTETRPEPMTLRPGIPIVGKTEMDRIQARFQPATPNHEYRLTADLLDQTEAAFALHTGGALARAGADHPLGSAVRHLRGRLAAEGWAPLETAVTAAAVTHVTGFLHFLATWARHPFLAAMVGWAAERGFSVHALAPFAAAHSLIALGNRIRFDEPLGYPERIGGFGLVSGDDLVGVEIEVFNRFEFPHGRPFEAGALQASVAAAIDATQGRINLRHPGMLVLSPGNGVAGYDEAVIEASKRAVASAGRKNRGLMAVALIALRLQDGVDRHAVRLGYVFLPIGNRHYRGESPLRMAG